VIPVVVGSSPISHPKIFDEKARFAKTGLFCFPTAGSPFMTTDVEPGMPAAGTTRRDFLAWSAAAALAARFGNTHAQAIAATPGADLLQFDIAEPGVEHHFYRQGAVAAHLQANRGTRPRLIVAFPAGNTGMGLWFESGGQPAGLGIVPGTRLDGVERADGMRGITARLRSDAARLDIGDAVLANIRTLRDYVTGGGKTLAPEFVARIDSEGGRNPSLTLRRTSVEGKHHLELRIVPERGTRLVTQGGRSALVAGPDGHVHMTVTALADYAPLTPFAMADLLTADAADRPLDKQALAFLASAENFSAGSWRFLTYFGRDTLLATSMLMPVLQPGAIEAALGSVLERLAPDGTVAHEDAIGEFAVLQNRRSPRPPADIEAPIRDYKMVDGDFLLAPVLAAYLLDDPRGKARSGAFLARRTTAGPTFLAQLNTNLDRVLQLATPFASHPDFSNLIALNRLSPVGNWRDSSNGLGGGRYPFDVNVALVPAALRAAERLYRSGLLGERQAAAARAAGLAGPWQDTQRLFAMTVPAAQARTQVQAYARAEGLDPAPAVAAITSTVFYDALALGASGQPIPVMHSDASFVLQFGAPPAAYLDTVAAQLSMPFPAGLRTAAGIVVANPAYAPEAVQRGFTRKDYHGTVVWSWQQAMLASGVRRQLARTDLPAPTRTALLAAEQALWQGILAAQERSAGELWSWQARDGKAALAMWESSDGDEACAAQLWSTVYLAIKPPVTLS
jgi:hypothetical protein